MAFRTMHDLMLTLLLRIANVSDDRQWSSLPFHLARILCIFLVSNLLHNQGRCHPVLNSRHCNKLHCNLHIPTPFRMVLEVPERRRHFSKLAFRLHSKTFGWQQGQDCWSSLKVVFREG